MMLLVSKPAILGITKSTKNKRMTKMPGNANHTTTGVKGRMKDTRSRVRGYLHLRCFSIALTALNPRARAIELEL